MNFELMTMADSRTLYEDTYINRPINIRTHPSE